MKFALLTMVAGTESGSRPVDTSGEDDELSNVVQLNEPAPVEITTPVMVDLTKIRAFYPRKKDHRTGHERVGTRLTFDNGSGMAVTDQFEMVASLVAQS